MLISILIYQSAVFVFLDGSRVSEGLVKVMVIWLSISLSLAQLFLLCPRMTVVVHSFVADSSLLDCCDLVVFFSFFLFFFSSTLSLQVGNRLVFCGGFSCLFLSFGVSCLLAWLGQPIFVCHQHLWFGLSFFATGIYGLFFLSLPQAFVYSLFLSRPFSAVGIRVRLFVFALSALVSGFRLWSKSH